MHSQIVFIIGFLCYNLNGRCVMKRKFLIILAAFIFFVSNSVYAAQQNVEINDSEKIKLHPNARNIPILMYHEVGYTPTDERDLTNYVHRSQLEAQMFLLQDLGVKTITMHELYDNWINGTELPEKCVVLTFDDGYASHFTIVNSILKRLNLKATFYIIEDRLFKGIENRDVEGLKKLYESGQEIGVHTVSHPDFHKLSEEEILAEIKDCKEFLEKTLDTEIKTFSYPFGNYNDESIKILKDLGFENAVVTQPGIAKPDLENSDSIFLMKRYNMSYTTSIEEFKNIVLNEN